MPRSVPLWAARALAQIRGRPVYPLGVSKSFSTRKFPFAFSGQHCGFGFSGHKQAHRPTCLHCVWVGKPLKILRHFMENAPGILWLFLFSGRMKWLLWNRIFGCLNRSTSQKAICCREIAGRLAVAARKPWVCPLGGSKEFIERQSPFAFSGPQLWFWLHRTQASTSANMFALRLGWKRTENAPAFHG